MHEAVRGRLDSRREAQHGLMELRCRESPSEVTFELRAMDEQGLSSGKYRSEARFSVAQGPVTSHSLDFCLKCRITRLGRRPAELNLHFKKIPRDLFHGHIGKEPGAEIKIYPLLKYNLETRLCGKVFTE